MNFVPVFKMEDTVDKKVIVAQRLPANHIAYLFEDGTYCLIEARQEKGEDVLEMKSDAIDVAIAGLSLRSKYEILKNKEPVVPHEKSS